MSRSLATLVALAAAVRALTVISPGGGAGWTAGPGKNELTWQSEAGDAPLFNVRLVNEDDNLLQGGLALATSIASSGTSIDIGELQINPGDGYVVELVSVTDINTIYASSIAFSIVAGSTPLSSAGASTSMSVAPTQSAGADEEDRDSGSDMTASPSALPTSSGTLTSQPGDRTNDTLVAPMGSSSGPVVSRPPSASGSATLLPASPSLSPTAPPASGAARVVLTVQLAVIAVVMLGGPFIGRI